MRIHLAIGAALACVPLGGCAFEYVRDIRDNLVVTNERLDRTEQLLQEVGRVNPKLDALQIQLDETKARLELVKSIDASLVSMDATLKSVDKSLASLDAHLASLRKTLENIDSTIPFLKFADPTPEPEAGIEAEGVDTAQDPPPAPPPGTPPKSS